MGFIEKESDERQKVAERVPVQRVFLGFLGWVWIQSWGAGIVGCAEDLSGQGEEAELDSGETRVEVNHSHSQEQ